MQKWIPRIIALLVGLAGIISLISALLPGSRDRLLIVHEFIPLVVRSGSRILTLLAGFGLIILAQNLLARKQRAWILSLILLSLTFITHLIKGLDIEESFVALIPIFFLIRYHFIFSVQSTKLKPIQIIKRSLLIITIVTLYALLGYIVLQSQFSTNLQPRSVELDYMHATTGLGKDELRPQSRWAHWFENSLGILTTAGGITIILFLFGPFIEHDNPTDEEHENMRALVIASPNAVGTYATMSDKQYFWNKNKSQGVAYRISKGVAVALGDPLGIGSGSDTCLEFVIEMKRRGLPVVFYSASNILMLRLKKLGYQSFKIGEEALIPLDAFTLIGAKAAELRHAVARMQREKMTYVWYTADTLPWSVLDAIDKLHRTWITQKNMPPMSFSMEYYPFPTGTDMHLLVLKNSHDKLMGVLSFMAYNEGSGMALDMMLRDKHAPNGLMEAAIAEAAEHFGRQGIHNLNLGLAPLANTHTGIQKFLSNFSHFYEFKSLHAFKAKLATRWEPKYIVTEKRANLPKITLALIAVHFQT